MIQLHRPPYRPPTMFMPAIVFVLAGISTSILSAATPTQLAFQGPGSATAGTCIAVPVVSEDAQGNLAPVATATTVTVSGQVLGSLFTGLFSDASCVHHAVTVVIPAKKSTATVYFSDKVAHQVTLSAVATGLTTGTQVFTVNPAAPVKLTFNGLHYLKTVGCSSPLTLSASDSYNNPSAVSQALTVTLSGNGLGTLYNDINCSKPVSAVTLPVGTASQPIYIRDSNPESLTLLASSTPFGNASIRVTVNTPSGPPVSTVGAGKVTYTCPAGATVVPPPPPPPAADNLPAAVAASSNGQTLCIEGEHRLAATITPKTNQTWIGVGTDVRISGAVQLTGWKVYSPGIWTYTGPYRTQKNTLVDFALNVAACYTVSIYQDDLFFRATGQANDQRVMRVLGLPELSGALTTAGQGETAAEDQRFFFDYDAVVTGSPAIYINFDPTNSIIDLPITQTVVTGTANTTGITIENITIEKALNTALYAGHSWTVQDTTVRFAHNTGLNNATGVQGAPFVLNRVLITNNGQYGLSGGNWATLENSEVSWNNIANYRKQFSTPDSNCGGYFAAGGMKVTKAQGVSASVPAFTMTNTQSHHNIGHGGWDDVGSQYLTVQGNHFYNNEGAGYFHEIGCDIAFSGNELNNNGGSIKNASLGFSALQLNNSNAGTFTGNTVHDNTNGSIILFLQASHSGMLSNACLGAANDTDTTNSLKNNLVESNSVYVCTVPAAVGQTDSNLQTAIQRNNQFVSNMYHVGKNATLFWTDPFKINWAQWQADQQDLQGTMTIGCNYP